MCGLCPGEKMIDLLEQEEREGDCVFQNAHNGKKKKKKKERERKRGEEKCFHFHQKACDHSAWTLTAACPLPRLDTEASSLGAGFCSTGSIAPLLRWALRRFASTATNAMIATAGIATPKAMPMMHPVAHALFPVLTALPVEPCAETDSVEPVSCWYELWMGANASGFELISAATLEES
jgi:hypothetical protein